MKTKFYRIHCNLCNAAFRSPTPYLRFCRICRAEDEGFRFFEWLR